MWDCGVVIEEVNQGFIQYAIEFKEKQIEYISLLQEQEKTVEYVLKIYGDMDVFDIKEEFSLHLKIPLFSYFSNTLIAHLIPSTAAVIIPPAYPAPSPQGYSPCTLIEFNESFSLVI